MLAACDYAKSELRLLLAEAAARVRQSKDYKEDPKAFVEKREPRWIGR